MSPCHVTVQFMHPSCENKKLYPSKEKQAWLKTQYLHRIAASWEKNEEYRPTHTQTQCITKRKLRCTQKNGKGLFTYYFQQKTAGEGKYVTDGLSDRPEFPAEEAWELKGGVPHTLRASKPKSSEVKHISQANFKDGGRGHWELQAPRIPARSPLKGSPSRKRGTTRSGGHHCQLQPPRPSGNSCGRVNFPGAHYY